MKRFTRRLPRLLTAGAERSTVFAAVLAELQTQPTVAVFEDVHWADEATLDLLRFLGRRIACTSALLVLTYRDDELGPRHPLRLLLGDLAASATTRRVVLPPLSQAAVRALVADRDMDAAALHLRTEGNPFFVTEVLASGEVGLPPTIRDAVLARAARLSSGGYAVLQVAAVIGPRVEPWLLDAIHAANASDVDESLAFGLLVAQGEQLAFRHELARQAILCRLHRRRSTTTSRRCWRNSTSGHAKRPPGWCASTPGQRKIGRSGALYGAPDPMLGTAGPPHD